MPQVYLFNRLGLAPEKEGGFVISESKAPLDASLDHRDWQLVQGVNGVVTRGGVVK